MMCMHYLRSLQCYLVVFLVVVFYITVLLLPRLQCYFIALLLLTDVVLYSRYVFNYSHVRVCACLFVMIFASNATKCHVMGFVLRTAYVICVTYNNE